MKIPTRLLDHRVVLLLLVFLGIPLAFLPLLVLPKGIGDWMFAAIMAANFAVALWLGLKTVPFSAEVEEYYVNPVRGEAKMPHQRGATVVKVPGVTYVAVKRADVIEMLLGGEEYYAIPADILLPLLQQHAPQQARVHKIVNAGSIVEAVLSGD